MPRPAAAPAPAGDDAAAMAFAESELAAASPSADDVAQARTERIRRVLDFEGRWASHGGAKARAIRAEFGWTTTRYYQVLDAMLDEPDAVRHDPMLVRRLQRIRDGR